MQLGKFELQTVSGGRFRVDGGAMFGVVPKALWSRHIAADDDNRTAQATNCVLVNTGSQLVLIDTGYGPDLSVRQKRNFQAEEGEPLLLSLADRGLTPEDIDVVVLSHLHFDHAGGATHRNKSNEFTCTFPEAEYVVQRGEWETALSESAELKGVYSPNRLRPLEQRGRLRLLEGDEEIVPGVTARVTGGHTRDHMAVIIESDAQAAYFLGDICPTTAHLPMFWCLSYDLDLLQTRRIKQELLTEISTRNAWALWDHDHESVASRIECDKRGEFLCVDRLAIL